MKVSRRTDKPLDHLLQFIDFERFGDRVNALLDQATFYFLHNIEPGGTQDHRHFSGGRAQPYQVKQLPTGSLLTDYHIQNDQVRVDK